MSAEIPDFSLELLVCRIPRARTTEDGIELLPVSVFLRRLWAGEFQPG